MSDIRVLICDDDGLIRDGLKMILSVMDGVTVVDTALDGEEGYKRAKLSPVDVVLMDIRMPNMNGVEATKKIKEETDSKVLILTTFDEEEYIVDAIKNGASGYMLKSSDPKEIVEAIKIVHKGHSYMQGDIMEKFKGSIFERNKRKNMENFTEREKQIIELISEGLSNREISETLYISEGTVKNYITSVLGKTELKHRTQIAIWYLKN